MALAIGALLVSIRFRQWSPIPGFTQVLQRQPHSWAERDPEKAPQPAPRLHESVVPRIAFRVARMPSKA